MIKTLISLIMRIEKAKGVLIMPNDEIYALKDCFVEALDPISVYLFGSYAYGTPTEDSDFDFYIVVDDGQTDTLDLMTRAYSACSEIKQHPVDILVGTKSRFESRKQRPTLENEVFNKGVLLYGA